MGVVGAGRYTCVFAWGPCMEREGNGVPQSEKLKFGKLHFFSFYAGNQVKGRSWNPKPFM